MDAGSVPRDEHARLVPERDAVAEPRAVGIRELVDRNGLTCGIVSADPAFAADAVARGDERVAAGGEPHTGDLGDDDLAPAPELADLTAIGVIHGRIQTAGYGDAVLPATEDEDGGIVPVPGGQPPIRGRGDRDAVRYGRDERALPESALVVQQQVAVRVRAFVEHGDVRSRL